MTCLWCGELFTDGERIVVIEARCAHGGWEEEVFHPSCATEVEIANDLDGALELRRVAGPWVIERGEA